MKRFFISLCVAALPLTAFSASAADESATPTTSVASSVPDDQQLADKAQARARALKEQADQIKAAAEAQHKEAQTACWQRTLVSACLAQAKDDHTAATIAARKLDTEARQIERDLRRREQAAKEAQAVADAPRLQAEAEEKAARGREETVQRAKRLAEAQAEREKRAAEGQTNAVIETRRRADAAAEREQKRKKAAEKARERAEKDKRRAEKRAAERRANGDTKP